MDRSKPRANRFRVRTRVLGVACASAFGLGAVQAAPASPLVRMQEDDGMDAVAEAYVRAVLAVGEHDATYVDAYYGPPEWREAVKAEAATLEEIDATAADLLGRLDRVDRGSMDEMERLRWEYLRTQLGALRSRVAMLGGARLPFDEESAALYDAVAPHHDEETFRDVLEALEARLPGEGSLVERYERFRERFVIPADRLDAVFRAAIDECRRRTQEHLELPEGEDFVVEYVTGTSWSAYNWYQGGGKSLIQVNTDLPISIDRAIDLACHEGYPGHHVYNALLERNLVRDRGWVEFSVYPLFSPQSLVAEGSANYGIDLCFPGEERIAFERDVLFPLAGLDPATAEEHAAVRDLTGRLSYAGNEAARRYLNGEIDRDAAAAWLERFALMPPEHARKRIRFFDDYRSYVINYNLGRDLVAGWVEGRLDPDATASDRWREFGKLLSSPRLPSGLAR